MRKNLEFIPTPQVEPSHYKTGYDNRGRWSSYWLQIAEVTAVAPRTVLEIGPGNGTVSEYMKRVLDIDVTTVDIDVNLSPDIVSDIAAMPFSDNSFDLVLASEVLEHVPFSHAAHALGELRRVASTAVVSVPNASRYVAQVFLGYGSRRVRLMGFDGSRFLRRPADFPIGEHEHYWEINRGQVSLQMFKEAVEEAGWSIDREYRNPDFPIHHFFVLR